MNMHFIHNRQSLCPPRFCSWLLAASSLAVVRFIAIVTNPAAVIHMCMCLCVCVSVSVSGLAVYVERTKLL